jgi:outer membrane receptor protein involved in Fe transport
MFSIVSKHLCENSDVSCGSTRTSRNLLRFGTSMPAALATAGALLATSPVFAADTALAPAANGTPPQTASQARQSEEIIVTTRKRSEKLLKVPASITALSAADLKRYNIQKFNDYATQVPSLSFITGGGSAYGLAASRAIAIRGVVGNNTTGFYIDDTPVPATIDPRVVDLQRIEVLKGPQGTLYGAESEGGNIRLISNPPAYDKSTYDLAANAGATSHGGSPDYGDSLIANLVLVPDQTALRLVQYDNHEAGFLTRTYPNPNDPSTRISVGNQGQITTTGYSAALSDRVTEDLTATLRMLFQNSYDYGWPTAYAPANDFTVHSYTEDRDHNNQEKSKDIWYLPSFVLNYTGTGYTVTSSTSYFDRSTHDVEDGTEPVTEQLQDTFGYAGPEQNSLWDLDETDKIFTQETRIAFDPIYHVSGVGGLYFSSERFVLLQPPSIYEGITPLYGDDNIYGGRSALYTRNAAAFGELYFHILPELTLTLGAREYLLHQEGNAYSTGIFGSPAPGHTDTYSDGLLPKAAISYQITPDDLIYATTSKGFRPGGGGTPVPSTCDADLYKLGLNTSSPLSFQSDSDWNYEAGFKSSLLDHRLSVTGALFQIDWKNIQQTINLADCGATFEGNAGAARIRGGELEVRSDPFLGVHFRAGLSYNDAHITSQGAGVQAVGQRINGVPTWEASAGAEYDHDITSKIQGFLSGDFSFTGDSTSADNSAGNPLVRKAYEVGNARAGIRFGSTELAFYINNFTNTKANLGDLQAISIVRIITNAGGTTNDLRVTLLNPLEAGIQLKQHF